MGACESSPVSMSGTPPPLYKPELLEEKKKLTILQHCYREPWIPIGCLTTVSALLVGLGGFLQGNRQLMQRMMRARVAAQGLTLTSMVLGLSLAAQKNKTEEP